MSASPRPSASVLVPTGAGRWGRGVRPGRIGAIALLAVLAPAVAACSNSSGVRTEVVQLDADGVDTLSREMAECVRATLGSELTDDFLVIGERMPVETDVLPPEAEQAFAACLAEANGVLPTQTGG
ncbi:MAG: hypothetical protein AAF962_02070 [Actinomycetota bacterium]